MNELGKHIEVLLLENDCVIIPGFGGFVAHYIHARRIEEEELFLPPTRTIGFNSQLKINDGLLVQSYMKAFDTDFVDAAKTIEKDAEELISLLHKEGIVEIHGVGKITLGINNVYEFHPYEDGLLSPNLYGLSSFEISMLSNVAKKDNTKINQHTTLPKEFFEIKINRTLLRHTAAVAAAIITFFFLSVPVENTYIEDTNYAMLGSGGLFENIKNQSLATSILPTYGQVASTQQPKSTSIKRNVTNKNLKPLSVRTEKVAPRGTETKNKEMATIRPTVKQEPKPQETFATQKGPVYNVIVASVGSKSDAGRMIEQLKTRGFDSASIIEGDGKIRVCLTSFSNQPDAYKKINQLKENGSFKDAWVLTTN